MQFGMLDVFYKHWHCTNTWKLQLSRMLWWALYKHNIWMSLKLLQWKCQERSRGMQKLCVCILTHTPSCNTQQCSWNPAAFPTCLKSWWFLIVQESCKLYVVTVKLGTIYRNDSLEGTISGVCLKIMTLCIHFNIIQYLNYTVMLTLLVLVQLQQFLLLLCCYIILKYLWKYLLKHFF